MSLNSYLIGDSLSSLRQYKGLSINELADGICTEEELISYEKEKAFPDLATLNRFADKLNIDLPYFFSIASKSLDNYSTAVIQLINQFKRNWNYEAIYDIVKRELENPIFQSITLKQFLMWHEGICVFYLENDTDKAINLLHEAINLTNPKQINLAEREIEILTGVGLLYKDLNNYTEAIEIFHEALNSFEKLPFLLDPKGKIRLLFGLTQALTEIGEYNESLIYCQKGIDLCNQAELLYLFANFHYQMGENYVRLGDIVAGKKFLENAVCTVKLQNNEKFMKILEAEMVKLLK